MNTYKQEHPIIGSPGAQGSGGLYGEDVMKRYDRCERRFQNVVRKKALRRQEWRFVSAFDTPGWLERTVNLRLNTRTLCSCMLCKSPRHWGNVVQNLTFQEQRCLLSMHDGLEEFYN